MAFNQLLIDQKPFRLKIFAVRTRLELINNCGPSELPVAHIVAFLIISSTKIRHFFETTITKEKTIYNFNIIYIFI